jgi:hypothetical protein
MQPKVKFISVISLAISVLPTLPSFASLVPINNASFENPIVTTFEDGGAGSGAIPDWTISGPGVAGVWQPGAFYPTTPAPNGNQTGFIGDGSNHGGTTTVSQVLSSDLLANTQYTLRLAIGAQPGFSPGTDYSVSLLAGAAVLTSVTPITPTLMGTTGWTYITATYTSGAIVSGDPLEITIATPEPQFLFDDISLTATAVPETSTIIAGAMLLLPFGLGAVRQFRKKAQVA